MVMTPHIATPALFQHGVPPWAMQTPETSPMLWGRAPLESYAVNPTASANKGIISKELLRSVCEPFFDQMVMAVHHALQVQQAADLQSQCESARPGSSNVQGMPCEEQSTAEGSDASDCGAFSAVFTPSTEEGCAKQLQQVAAQGKAAGAENSAPVELQAVRQAESEDGSDHEKSVMVCRHWKSKGWCRMEGSCKFAHPEHKRGVGSVAASGIVAPTSEQHSAPPVDAKKKSSKRRKNKGKAEDLKDELSMQRPLVQLSNYAAAAPFVPYAQVATPIVYANSRIEG
jgi:hypothetical protein